MAAVFHGALILIYVSDVSSDDCFANSLSVGISSQIIVVKDFLTGSMSVAQSDVQVRRVSSVLVRKVWGFGG
jgi:hypothetical protein